MRHTCPNKVEKIFIEHYMETMFNAYSQCIDVKIQFKKYVKSYDWFHKSQRNRLLYVLLYWFPQLWGKWTSALSVAAIRDRGRKIECSISISPGQNVPSAQYRLKFLLDGAFTIKYGFKRESDDSLFWVYKIKAIFIRNALYSV